MNNETSLNLLTFYTQSTTTSRKKNRVIIVVVVVARKVTFRLDSLVASLGFSRFSTFSLSQFLHFPQLSVVLVVACKHRAAAAHTAPPHELIYHSFLLQAFLLLSLRASTKRDRELFYLELSLRHRRSAAADATWAQKRNVYEMWKYHTIQQACSSSKWRKWTRKRKKASQNQSRRCRRWWRWSASVFRNFFDFPIISILLLFSCFAKKKTTAT